MLISGGLGGANSIVLESHNWLQIKIMRLKYDGGRYWTRTSDLYNVNVAF